MAHIPTFSTSAIRAGIGHSCSCPKRHKATRARICTSNRLCERLLTIMNRRSILEGYLSALSKSSGSPFVSICRSAVTAILLYGSIWLQATAAATRAPPTRVLVKQNSRARIALEAAGPILPDISHFEQAHNLPAAHSIDSATYCQQWAIIEVLKYSKQGDVAAVQCFAKVDYNQFSRASPSIP